MSKPHIAATTPFAIDVEKGKDYYWCACGLSKSQPFCDGSHKMTRDEPPSVLVRYVDRDARRVREAVSVQPLANSPRGPDAVETPSG